MHYLQNGGGEALNVLGYTDVLKITGAETGGQYFVLEVNSPPGGGPPMHCHTREDEFFYVLEGEYEITLGEARKTIRLKPGDCAFSPRGIPHRFQNVSDGPGKMLVTVSPAGLEGFFREISARVKSMPEDAPALLEIGERYGLEFLP